MKRSFTSGLGSYWKYLKAFIAFVPHFLKQYQILHVHYFFPFVIAAHFYKALRPKTKIVVTFHGSDINERINSRNATFFKKFTSKLDYVIAVGQDLSQIVFEKLALKCDQILSAGIEDRAFKLSPGVEKKYHFTFASSFIERKGIDIFLEAIYKLNRTDLSYCFIGSGILEPEIRKMADQFDFDIKLNLTQSEMCEVFNRTYFHVLPSRFEPFGLVVTEAMFCGTPSIVSNVGGLKDQVKQGYNGFILDENIPNVLADQMSYCIDVIEKNAYQKIHKAALVSNKEHSLTNVMKETVSIYNRLLNANG